MDNKHPGMQEGYLMSQSDVGIILGLHKSAISKAENSLLKKLRDGIAKNGISEVEFFTYLKYQEL